MSKPSFSHLARVSDQKLIHLLENLLDARVAFEAEFFDVPDAAAGTDFAAGVTRALLELVGPQRLALEGVDGGLLGEIEAKSVYRTDSRKVIMFLTDMSSRMRSAGMKPLSAKKLSRK